MIRDRVRGKACRRIEGEREREREREREQGSIAVCCR